MDTFTLDNQATLDFPRLSYGDFVTSSPKDKFYNCIAFAAEDNNRLRAWWPIGGYWPSGVNRNLDINSFIEAFETQGYEVCSDAVLEEGYKKIAIYELNDVPTHAALQLSDGKWKSKIGKNNDIQHNDLECIGGGLYGEPTTYMKKPI